MLLTVCLLSYMICTVRYIKILTEATLHIKITTVSLIKFYFVVTYKKICIKSHKFKFTLVIAFEYLLLMKTVSFSSILESRCCSALTTIRRNLFASLRFCMQVAHINVLSCLFVDNCGKMCK